MANIINIETSTDVCSVALSTDGGIRLHREEREAHNHAKVLTPFLKDVMDYAAMSEIKIDAVAVSIGPGSYTGLRIGLSEAKGLAFGLNVPLIGIDTLKLLCVSAMFRNDLMDETIFIPMIDARRMEVFTGVFDLALNPLMPEQPVILDEDSFAAFRDYPGEIVLMGNGAAKAMPVLKLPRAKFIQGVEPMAMDMVALSELAFRNNDFIDLAYSTPNYLKDFQASTPKNRL